jgi:hypothetical protein
MTTLRRDFVRLVLDREASISSIRKLKKKGKERKTEAGQALCFQLFVANNCTLRPRSDLAESWELLRVDVCAVVCSCIATDYRKR